MNVRLTLTLVLIAIVLGASVLLVPAGGNPPATPNPVVSVLSFDADQIASLELENNAGDTVLAEKRDANWVVVSPREWPADSHRLESFVSRIASLVASAEFQPDEPLSDFGLDPPALTVRIRMSGGADHLLYIGAHTPDRRSTYGATSSGTQVFVLPNLIAADAEGLLQDPPYLSPTP